MGTVCLMIFAAVLLLLAILWVLVPPFYGPPSVPTRRDRIRRALQMADLQPGETLYDLGAGDGRVLVMAAREFGARAVGIEIGPVQRLVSWANAFLNGVGSRVRMEAGDFFQADLREADVVFAYLTSREAGRLQRHLEGQLRSGARVVTISFDFPGWQSTAFDRDHLIFLYRMPPSKPD
jgi:precorrin-6B methylase 2